MMDLFRELWLETRDYYAPTTSTPKAVRMAVDAMNRAGHEAVTAGPDGLMVDGELFTLKKVKGHSHFDLRQHGIRI